MRLMVLVAAIAALWFSTAQAQVQLLIPSDPGGNYDIAGRIIAKHLPKYLKRQVIPQNMPGAGGQIVANHLANIAPRDGSVIGLVQGSVVQEQALGGKGVRFDASKFEWIGSPTRQTGLLVVLSVTGVKSIMDIRQRETLIGASNVRHVAYAKLMNEQLGMKFKVIKGYRTVADQVAALARGEIEAMNAFTWLEWAVTHPDWVREKKITPLINTSTLADLSPEFEFMARGDDMGRALAAPPGVWAAELRGAFRYMVRDADFMLDALKVGMAVEMISGVELATMTHDILATPKETIDVVKASLD
jgi:hypothetical protein